MAPPAAACGSILDRIPDEVLEPILNDTLHCDVPFLLGDCAAAFDRDAAQKGHLSDWRLVTGTCRRIRRVGKKCFFSAKPIAWTFSALDRLMQGSFSPLSAADQATMLDNTREIAILDVWATSASRLLRLPNYLKAFPRLRRCTLLFGYARDTDPAFAFESLARHDRAGEGERVKVPVTFRELLLGIGVPSEVKLEVATTGFSRWDQHVSMLEKNVYPLLRFKAGALARKKGDAASEK